MQRFGKVPAGPRGLPRLAPRSAAGRPRISSSVSASSTCSAQASGSRTDARPSRAETAGDPRPNRCRSRRSSTARTPSTRPFVAHPPYDSSHGRRFLRIVLPVAPKLMPRTARAYVSILRSAAPSMYDRSRPSPDTPVARRRTRTGETSQPSMRQSSLSGRRAPPYIGPDGPGRRMEALLRTPRRRAAPAAWLRRGGRGPARPRHPATATGELGRRRRRTAPRPRRYLLLDTHSRAQDDAAKSKIVAAALWLSGASSTEDAATRLRELAHGWSVSRNLEAVDAMLEWLGILWPRLFPDADRATLAAWRRDLLNEEEGMSTLAERVRAWETDLRTEASRRESNRESSAASRTSARCYAVRQTASSAP